tara:strand:- start:174 stop:287 length:114 start_codon:yes stop_codon:yes gene_type:complete
MSDDDINKLEEFMKCLETFSITIGACVLIIAAGLIWL